MTGLTLSERAHSPLESGVKDNRSIPKMCSMRRQKDVTLKDELPRLVGGQHAAGEEQKNSSRRKEEAEPQWKQCPAVDVSGNDSIV